MRFIAYCERAKIEFSADSYNEAYSFALYTFGIDDKRSTFERRIDRPLPNNKWCSFITLKHSTIHGMIHSSVFIEEISER